MERSNGCKRLRVGVVAVLVGLGALALAGLTPGFAQVSFSGTNAITLTLADFPSTFDLTLSDTLSLSYRYDRFSISARTVLLFTGFGSQDFRLSAPLGDFALQGGVSFDSRTMTRANLNLSGTWDDLGEGVAFMLGLVTSNLGSSQTPSYGWGSTYQMSGSTPFGRITGIIGVGATPGGQVQTSCCYCYEGARIQVSNVETLCDGIASFDVSFGKTGIDAENLSWSGTIPAIDVGIRITVRWLELLEFQGLSFSVNTTLGDISVYGSGSFDQDLDFGTASWSLRGPFYGGTLSASTTLDLTGILSQSFTWSYRFNGCSISVTPTFDILSFSDAYTMSFDIPSIRVNGNCRLSCCGGADLGTLSWSTTVSKAGFSQISITYTNSF